MEQRQNKRPKYNTRPSNRLEYQAWSLQQVNKEQTAIAKIKQQNASSQQAKETHPKNINPNVNG